MIEEKKFPGITIFLILGTIIGIFGIVTGVFAIVGIPILILNCGLYMRKNWARIISVIIAVLIILLFILLLWGGPNGGGLGYFAALYSWPILLYNLCFLYYFNLPEVKEQFK